MDGQTQFYLHHDRSPLRSSFSEYQPEVTATGDQLKGIVTLDKIQDLGGGGFEH